MSSFFATPESAVINKDTNGCLEVTYKGIEYIVYKKWNEVVEANPVLGKNDDHIERFVGKWIPGKKIIEFY